MGIIMNWKVLSSKYILTKRWMTVRQDEVELPTGHVIPEYFVFEYPEWVNVIAITDEGKFLLVKQYRHGVGRVCWEIPAGVVEKTDGSALAGAKRELLEETGYGNGDWSELMQISGNAASWNNITHCFLAKGVRKIGGQNLDDGEDLVCDLKDEAEVRAMLERGEFVQSLMVAPLWKYFSQKEVSAKDILRSEV